MNNARTIVENLEANIEGNLNPNVLAVVNSTSGKDYKSASKINSASIPSNLLPKIYKGGKTEYGDAYGSLFLLESGNGDKVFVTGKPVYTVDKKSVSKKAYEESDSKDKSVSVVPDFTHQYTFSQLQKQVASSTQKGARQFAQYESNMPKAEASQSKVVSAEKQLNIPDVNQNLKKRYLELKNKYPSIDTSGILGDKAHQERKSDHNTKDAIDIVNFNGKEASILSDLQKDPTVSYIIFNKKIWKPNVGWGAYKGENPHTNHIHVSFSRSGGAPAQNKANKAQTFKSKKGITFTVE